MFTNYQKYLIPFLFLCVSTGNNISQNIPEHDVIISVERIWGRATHNAFTNLVNPNY